MELFSQSGHTDDIARHREKVAFVLMSLQLVILLLTYMAPYAHSLAFAYAWLLIFFVGVPFSISLLIVGAYLVRSARFVSGGMAIACGTLELLGIFIALH